ncbi:SRPBCC family protein [Streptomyces sp. NPDC050704]|uniref:SRPBCC family protein n=1 Tax=Streptomyces sp. NPDC050704 TaxID=3157219 RepID=UPI00341D10A9
MALFLVRRESPLAPAEAWRRVTAWQRHAEVVPLTRVSVLTEPPTGTGAGTVFVARSGLGPLAFDDVMEVVVWRPPPPHGEGPGMCRLVKRGTFVTGWAEIEVHPAADTGDTGSRVVWREELAVRLVPRALDPLVRWAARWMFGRALDRLLRHP